METLAFSGNTAAALNYLYEEVNIWAVLLGVVLTFVLGFIWYHEKVFGTAWMEDLGKKKKDLEKVNMAKTFGGTFFLTLIAGLALAVLLHDAPSAYEGALAGGVIGLSWVATGFGVNYLFEDRPMRLFLINAGYNVASLTILGAVIGGWN